MTRIREKIEAYFASSRRVRQAVALFLIVAAVVGVTVAIRKAVTRELDLYVILNASRQMLAGADIYAAPGPNGAYYLYLPLLAFLFVPLTLIPQSVAGVVWTLACIALIGWSLHESIKLMGGDIYAEMSPFELWSMHLVPVIFCADAISSEVGNAQVNCLILAAAVFGLNLAKRKSDLAAGTILGFATVAKIFAAPLLLYELLNRRFRLVAASVAGAIVVALLPAILIGWQRNLDLVSYWTTNIALHGDVASHRSGLAGNVSIPAVLTRLFTSEPAFVWSGEAYHLTIGAVGSIWIGAIGILIPLLALLVLVLYFLRFRHRQPLTSYWGGIALAFSIAPLITPVLERPHFVMLLPAYVYVSWMWLHERIESKLFYSLLLAAFVLSTFTLKLYVGEFWGNIFWSLGAPTLADIFLIAAIFVAATSGKPQDLTDAG
jgi:alpha-1,2-mannosyltransferase